MTDGHPGAARKGATGGGAVPGGATGKGGSGKGADDSRAEQVLSQALRVMAGGGKQQALPPTDPHVTKRRLTTGQLILLAAILGLMIGIVAGFVSLML